MITINITDVNSKGKKSNMICYSGETINRIKQSLASKKCRMNNTL